MMDALTEQAPVPKHDALPEHALPVIDISPFIADPEADGEEAKKKVARSVHDACVESGFFLISNYQGVLPQDKVDGLFQLMRRFFSLSPAYKRQLKGSYGRGSPSSPFPLHHAPAVPASATERRALASSPRCAARTLLRSRGYFAYGEENLSTIYPEHNVNFEDKDLGDYKEGLDFGPEVPTTDPHYGELFHTPNQWPDPASVGEEWKAQVLEYFELASRLGHVLNRIFAISLGLPENWFEDRICPPLPTLRLLHYPPSPVEQTRMGCGAHSDYGCCAILAQDDAGGLELYNRKGQWVAVKPVPQTLVINIGDMMQRWTNDRYKSTLHRVINPSTGKHRFSSPFFFEPGVDCMVECVPTCLAEGESPRYPPTRFGDHLLNMYNSTFYVNPTDQSGHDGDPGAATVLP